MTHATRGRMLLAAALGAASRMAVAQQEKTTILGDFDEDRFGSSLASVGDVDLDGYPDFVVGANRDDDGGLDSGTIRLVSGKSGITLRQVAGAAGQRLGSSVGATGDLDGDGVPDFAGGAPDAAFEQGFFGAYSSATGALLLSFAPSGGGAKRLGEAVTGAGDVDLDGVPDVIVGAPLESHAVNRGGRVRVFSGATGAVIRQLDGTGNEANLGASVAVFDGLIGSGHPDFLVGAPGQSGGGQVHTFAGQNGALLSSVSIGAIGPNRFGSAVAVIDDVNGDGFEDFVVGAPRLDANGVDSGGVFLFRGLFSTLMRQWGGNAAGDELGAAVAFGGDIDGDGVGDVLAGAPLHDGGGLDAGQLLVLAAAGPVMYSIEGSVAGDAYGRCCDLLGDLDGDGVVEFGAGAPEADLAGNLSGAVRIHSRACGSTTPVGASCATGGGTSPQLQLRGCFVGGGNVTLAIIDGVPAGAAWLFLGFASPPLALPGGCALHLAPLPVPVLLPLDPNGAFELVIGLPLGAVLVPFRVQALMADPGVAGGVAATHALEITPP